MSFADDFPKIADTYIKLAKFLTWPRFFKTFATLIMAICVYSMFENRQQIYNGVIVHTAVRTMIQAPISAVTKNAIQEILDRMPSITGVQLVSVDFKTNTRDTEYFKSNSQFSQNVFENYRATKIAPTPFFTMDLKNNERNTAIMNGDFICVPVESIPIYQTFPEIKKIADTVCSVSIPPYPGYFSGYVSFYVKGTPSEEEQHVIRAVARKLALTSYDSDIGK